MSNVRHQEAHAVAIRAFEFETQRLSFLVWRESHRVPFAEMNADPEVMRFFPSTHTAEQSNASVSLWLSQFEEQGWSNWAVQLRSNGEFMGFIGLTVPRRQFAFSPCVEIGWRLKRASWGQGYATEGANECLRVGFERVGLNEIVSFTALKNLPSIAVMERIGMSNSSADFEHPALAAGHPLSLHCLYKLSRTQWQRRDA